MQPLGIEFMPQRMYAVFDEVYGFVMARSLDRGEAVRIAIQKGIGYHRIVDCGRMWELHAGPSPLHMEPTGFGVTAADRDEAERGCLAIASLRRIWGCCAIVADEDVEFLASSASA